MTILLVEDDPGDALLVQASLSEAGVPDSNIVWARTVADGMAALASRPPGCVLLDLGLPDAMGYSAVDTIVAAVPDVAVIVLTGRQERDGMDALSAGAQDYLIKDGITGELLERSIRYAVERKRAQGAQQQLREVQLSSAEQARLERGLLPTPLLRTENVSCATYYRPGADHAVLGGDFYDVVETVDGRVRAVVGDVMGHGPDEAALGVHLRVAWRSLLLAGVPDEQILPTLDMLLSAEQAGQPRFVTVCDLTLEPGPDGALLRVRLAGHPAPIVAEDGAARYPDLHVGRPLGIDLPVGRHRGWPDNRVPLTPGASVLIYTDGLLDAHSPSDSSGLGISEVVSAVRACSAGGTPATTWLPSLVTNTPHESADDIAVVVLGVGAVGQASG